jgi:hypothetical protein
MRTLYEAANAVEAHMLAELLRQRGFEAHIQGEHLQGAIGELPAAGLVRLVIDEEQHAAARAVIDEWEALQPPTPTAPPPRTSRFKWLALGVLLGAGSLYAVVRTPVDSDGVDYNRDGHLDETWTYAPRGTVLKAESDRNRDGKVDQVIQYDERGLVASAERDDDFDGRFETRTRFHEGNTEFEQSDTDGDGYFDLQSHYRHGVLERSEHRDPVSGHVLRVEHFRLGKITRAELDTDRDGELDTQLEYNGLAEVSSRRTYQRQP